MHVQVHEGICMHIYMILFATILIKGTRSRPHVRILISSGSDIIIQIRTRGFGVI